MLPQGQYERLAVDHEKIEALLRAVRNSLADMVAANTASGLDKVVGGLGKMLAGLTPLIEVEERSFEPTAIAEVRSLAEQSRLSI